MPRLPPWIALIACSLLVVSFLFPPFLEVPRSWRHSPSFAGFQLIFDISSSNDLALDFKTLLVEWLGIVLLAVGLSYVRVSRTYLRRVAVGAGVVLLVGLLVWLSAFFGTPDTRLSKSQFINPFLRDESALAGQTATLTDEEVFGSPKATLTDEEFMGGASTAQPNTKKTRLTHEEFMGGASAAQPNTKKARLTHEEFMGGASTAQPNTKKTRLTHEEFMGGASAAQPNTKKARLTHEEFMGGASAAQPNVQAGVNQADQAQDAQGQPFVAQSPAVGLNTATPEQQAADTLDEWGPGVEPPGRTETHPGRTDPLVADRGLPGHYSTIGNAKAKELEVSFDFPTDWRGAEGKRPNAFYTVTSKDGRGREGCSLVIKDVLLPPDVTPTKQELAELFAPEGLPDFLPDGATFLGGDRTTLDGEPGAWVNFVQSRNMVGVPIRIMAVNFYTYYDTRVIIFGCAVGNPANLPMQDLQRTYRATLPTFQQMANSLVIHNKWRNRVESGAPSVKAH